LQIARNTHNLRLGESIEAVDHFFTALKHTKLRLLSHLVILSTGRQGKLCVKAAFGRFVADVSHT